MLSDGRAEILKLAWVGVYLQTLCERERRHVGGGCMDISYGQRGGG